MATKREKEEIRKVFIRTISNCCWYESKGDKVSLLNEIGVLRGLGYAIYAMGDMTICPHNDIHFTYFIDLQQKLKDEFNKEVNE